MVVNISIIIPCYNAVNYISNCVKSLQNQKYTRWEAIFIDDGSKDDTYKSLQNYTQIDSRIKVYTQNNQGAAKAREYGISKCVGDFITFMDVDDTLCSDALELMINAIGADVDIVVTGFNILKNNKIIKFKQLKFKRLSSIDYLENVLSGKYGWELCAKMYRRHLFESSIKTPVGLRVGEDAAVYIQLVCNAKYVRIIPNRVYNYIQYEQSASHVKSMEYAEETLQASFFIEGLLKKSPFYEQIKKCIDTMFLLFYSNSTRKGYLSKQHPLVKKIKDEHFNIFALLRMPIKKAIYLILCYYFSFNKYFKL